MTSDSATPDPQTAAAPGEAAALRAVIFLGASSMDLMISETAGENARIIDVLTQPVPLARDIFRKGYISRATMDRCVQIMDDYMTLLREYGTGTTLDISFLATNIVQDMANMDTFMNRLHIAHGLRLRVIDDGEMTRLIYMSVRAVLRKNPDLLKKRVLVVHAGPGNTRLLLFEKGRITRYSSYRLGTHRTGETIGDIDYSDDSTEITLVREHIRGQIDQIQHDFHNISPPDTIIIIGAEIQKLLPLLNPKNNAAINAADISSLAEHIASKSVEQRMIKLEQDYSSIASVLPALIINLAIAQLFGSSRIIIPPTNYGTDFLNSLILSHTDTMALEDEVLHFAALLSDRYQADRAHSRQVAKLGCMLFDALQNLHRLGKHDRLLLHVAAILHEIGTYINPKRHHQHSQYIILNSELFGLSRSDVEIIALLARYHRHGAPTTDEPTYAELEPLDRLRVQKLAAILRVADALERSHSQRIRKLGVRIADKRLEIIVEGLNDITIENMAMSQKGDLFTDIFGYEIALIPTFSR